MSSANGQTSLTLAMGILLRCSSRACTQTRRAFFSFRDSVECALRDDEVAGWDWDRFVCVLCKRMHTQLPLIMNVCPFRLEFTSLNPYLLMRYLSVTPSTRPIASARLLHLTVSMNTLDAIGSAFAGIMMPDIGTKQFPMIVEFI